MLIKIKMKKTAVLLFIALIVSFSACNKKKDPLQVKKEKLTKYKTQLQDLRDKIDDLEKQIALEDPEFAKMNRKATLITALPVKKEKFVHYVEVSGSVQSKKNVLLSAENMGNIQNILVSEGDIVKKGQLILTQDTDLLQKGLAQLQTQYDLAKTMYEKQKNLWDKNIGTQVQYLEAKNRKESLEDQIANVKTQIQKSQVRAPFDGTIDDIPVKEGEMAPVGSPLVRIVNHKSMYVQADLSETYISKFKQGDPVTIFFPAYNKSIETRISAIGQVIQQKNRTFEIEAKLPELDFVVKPNLLAILKIKDFEADNAPVVPTNLIQQDNKGDFVYVVSDTGQLQVAQKVHIGRGVTYKNNTMVESGLQGNELLVDEGFREVTDGNKVKIVENVM